MMFLKGLVLALDSFTRYFLKLSVFTLNEWFERSLIGSARCSIFDINVLMNVTNNVLF